MIASASTKFSRGSVSSAEPSCEVSRTLWDGGAFTFPWLNMWTTLSAVDLTCVRSCEISDGEVNPKASWRTGRQHRDSMSSLNEPRDINSATEAVHTFKTSVEGKKQMLVK